MPFHDLNVIYKNDASLSTTLGFLRELDYSTVALTVKVDGKLPSQLPTVPTSRPGVPPSLVVLSRLTLTVSDTSQNHRVNALTAAYDLVALRPTNDKSFQLCCSSLDCDIISLDFTQRVPFPIKFKTVAAAVQRGVRFEICYSGGVTGAGDARRNLIAGAGALIRATRGRGIIVSSEAAAALGVRAPWDVINLATVWGLSPERAKEAICEEAGRLTRLAGMKRSSFRGVVDIVEDGTHLIPPAESKRESDATGGSSTNLLNDQPTTSDSPLSQPQPQPQPPPLPEMKQVTVVPDKTPNGDKAKRKASTTSLNDGGNAPRDGSTSKPPLSKREMKRQAKKARLDRAAGTNTHEAPVADLPSHGAKKTANKSNTFPILHETISSKKKS